MAESARELAERFERINDEIMAIVEACSDEQWATIVPEEGRTVGVVCHHVGERYGFQTRLAQALSTGAAGPPDNIEAVNVANAQHMERYANCTKDEALELLRRNGAATKAFVEALTDEQLEREGRLVLYGDRPVTARIVIEGRLLGHPRSHIQGIRKVLGDELPAKGATTRA
jgi:uncharacterized damage-inducible protein DinB